MSIATRLRWYLDSHDVEYELIHHSHSSSSLDSAKKAHVPAGRMAKCVLLEDESGYLLAILPASCRMHFTAIEELLHRQLELATEEELAEIFRDCEIGAVPAIGLPYNVPMLVDDSLLRLPDLYFEAGDHEDLVHMSGEAFRALAGQSLHGRISAPN